MNQQAILYLPLEDDREELCELRLIRERTAERVKVQRAKAVEAECLSMKERARREAKAERCRKAKVRQRNVGYWVGASVGVLMVLAWAFTKDTGITALPLVLGGILMGRLK